MIAPADVLGITEDWTGMKVVGGEEGCVSKAAENAGLVRFAVLCFVWKPSLSCMTLLQEKVLH